jgi:amino acid adenylation domain-containing protein/non-ribosomal peptide synthase protein (TIGR01720 family)
MQQAIEGFQLSPQQKRLWQLQQIDTHQPYYAQCTVMVSGDLNLDAFQRAVHHIVDRHEILRTTFQTLPEMTVPLQVITPASPVIDYHNLSHCRSTEQSTQIKQLIQQFEQPSHGDASRSPLQIMLIQLAADRHLLGIRLPALCADSTTLTLLIREISRVYADSSQHNALSSDEPLQYADLAAWQNELLAGEDAASGQAYWQQQTISHDLTSKLPFAALSMPSRGFAPQRWSVQIAPERVERLMAVVQHYSVSMSTLLLTGWYIWLWRFTRQTDLVVGVAGSGRQYEELESALGPLTKYLPVASSLDSTSRFHQVLEQVNDAVQNALIWQEIFVWDDLPQHGEPSTPYFLPIGFEFQSLPKLDSRNSISQDSVCFSIQQQLAQVDRFTLKLLSIFQENTLTLEFHYNSTELKPEQVQSFAHYFQSLLEQISKHGNQLDIPINEFTCVNEHDRHQLLVEFNQTTVDFGLAECIHHRFEQNARNIPDHTAVVVENRSLTYAELNAKANQLAHYLQTLGVVPETIVGLYVERSLELAMGLLGTLKAGGAYLPLDPALPSERLHFMVQDTQVPIILTQHHYLPALSNLRNVQIICLDAAWDTIAQCPATNLNSHSRSNHLAYIIYTSGSTGQPKGVAVEHRQLFNYVNGILSQLELPTGSSFAAVSTFAADLGNTSIFSAWCLGGCLHILTQERVTNPDAFAAYCSQHSIDCLKIVPSHLNALLSAATQPESLLPRQCLILGGERLRWELVNQIQQYRPQCQIFNHYGPTEATIGALLYPVKKECHAENESDRWLAQTVPLGRPIANTQVYILDDYLQPVPIGVPGEIYIGGAGLARGYLNRPTLTTDRFISHPSGHRLYKTGDLARYLPNGAIEFLGRVDHQVKLHGFRVELGEIEAVLTAHPAVEAAVVMVRTHAPARSDKPEQIQLVAYVVPKPDSATSDLNIPQSWVTNLRNVLNEKLPDYMVPHAFVVLKSLPLTANGKVDRQALPEPSTVNSALNDKIVPPRTPVEAELVRIWADVLRLEQVSIHDNFFELGGDSILSIQAIARANRAGLTLVPRQLFEHPTIAELAIVTGTSPAVDAEQGLVTGNVPLTPIQHWFFEQELQEPHHWNQALLLSVDPALTPALLEQAIHHLVAHHDALRLRFEQQSSGWVAVHGGLEGALVPVTSIDLASYSDAEQATQLETIANQLQASLDLTNGPLMRVAWFHIGCNQPNQLLLILHHLVVDGVSWRILLEDLQQVCQQLMQADTVQLPPKTTSFQQWANALQAYAQSTTVQQEVNDWLTVGDRSPTPIPVDFNHFPDSNLLDNHTVATAKTVLVSLSETETQALLQDVPAAYHTQINDVLLTALVQSFAQWTGQSALLVELEGHGREAISETIDLSRTIGWFTAIFPVWLTLDGIEHPGEALKAIKEQLRRVPQRGIGYGILRYLAGVRLLKELPQPSVRFNYLGQFNQILPEHSLFSIIHQTLGAGRSPRDRRRYLLDINGFVIADQLHFEWMYSDALHQRRTIETIAQQFVTVLRSLITHCQSLNAPSFTPSDFPQAHMSQADLDRLLTQIGTTQQENSL